MPWVRLRADIIGSQEGVVVTRRKDALEIRNVSSYFGILGLLSSG